MLSVPVRVPQQACRGILTRIKVRFCELPGLEKKDKLFLLQLHAFHLPCHWSTTLKGLHLSRMCKVCPLRSVKDVPLPYQSQPSIILCVVGSMRIELHRKASFFCRGRGTFRFRQTVPPPRALPLPKAGEVNYKKPGEVPEGFFRARNSKNAIAPPVKHAAISLALVQAPLFLSAWIFWITCSRKMKKTVRVFS
jgi:hypothetical protein